MTVPPMTVEQAAELAQRLPCDCDWSAEIEGCPHREWCTQMTPLGVIRDIADAAAPLIAAAQREADAQLALSHANKPTWAAVISGDKALREFADLLRGAP